MLPEGPRDLPWGPEGPPVGARGTRLGELLLILVFLTSWRSVTLAVAAVTVAAVTVAAIAAVTDLWGGVR